MTNPRNILNEFKWKENLNLDLVEILIIHRGAPNNIKKISGKDILKIGRSFIHTSSAMIPFHRIIIIMYEGKTVFNRNRLE